MALDQSALLEVLDALRNADAADRITQAAETIYQALIDAELTAVIGAGPYERTDSRTNQPLHQGDRGSRRTRLSRQRFDLARFIGLSPRERRLNATIPPWSHATSPRPWSWSARCAINCSK
jgi:Transposase, Mutator family